MHPIRTHLNHQASHPIHRLQLFQADVAIQRTPAEGVAMCLAARLSMANLRYTLNKHVNKNMHVIAEKTTYEFNHNLNLIYITLYIYKD